jgi:hypothetical protein
MEAFGFSLAKCIIGLRHPGGKHAENVGKEQKHLQDNLNKDTGTNLQFQRSGLSNIELVSNSAT